VGFRADLVVDSTVAVELKCQEALHPVDEAQLLSHLRLLKLPVGLLINFHVMILRDGIKRMVYNYVEPFANARDSLRETFTPPRPLSWLRVEQHSCLRLLLLTFRARAPHD